MPSSIKIVIYALEMIEILVQDKEGAKCIKFSGRTNFTKIYVDCVVS
jgi:hypothetical protein